MGRFDITSKSLRRKGPDKGFFVARMLTTGEE
jgi:hypothetical protein